MSAIAMSTSSVGLVDNPVNTFLNSTTDFNTLINGYSSICLWVIDMQNDFIDVPFEDKTLFSEDELNGVKGKKTKSNVVSLGGPAYLISSPIKK